MSDRAMVLGVAFCVMGTVAYAQWHTSHFDQVPAEQSTIACYAPTQITCPLSSPNVTVVWCPGDPANPVCIH